MHTFIYILDKLLSSPPKRELLLALCIKVTISRPAFEKG